MRDITRIRKFCNELADIWEEHCPDWRFNQLIENIWRSPAMEGKIPFFMEESEMMDIIKRCFGINEESHKGIE